jgi:hypothetical protein
MERFKVYLLIGNENVSINTVKWQNSTCENARFLKHRFFRNAIDLTHIKGFFVEFFDNHLIYALL